MTNEPERSTGLREELEGPDRAGHATARTGAGGESGRSDDPQRRRDELGQPDGDPVEADEAIVGHVGSGSSGLGMVAPPPGTEWPDPMGGDDEERELERRTR